MNTVHLAFSDIVKNEVVAKVLEKNAGAEILASPFFADVIITDNIAKALRLYNTYKDATVIFVGVLLQRMLPLGYDMPNDKRFVRFLPRQGAEFYDAKRLATLVTKYQQS